MIRGIPKGVPYLSQQLFSLIIDQTIVFTPQDPEAPTDLETKAKIAACKLQAVFRSKRLYRQRLHRDNLSQRLLFEWSLLYGAMRLFNQVDSAVCLEGGSRCASGLRACNAMPDTDQAHQLSGDSRTKRGIYHNLK
eukprot:307542-Rhodomonas_salina.1